MDERFMINGFNKLYSYARKFPWLVVFFLSCILYFGIFWLNAIIVTDKGDLSVGLINMWGDWAVHFTMGSTMAYREWIPSTSPLLLDAHFSYPFVSNWVSAMLVRLGVPFFSAFTIISMLFSVLFVVAVFSFYQVVLRRPYLAMLAVLFFFFNGGVGFFDYLNDAFSSQDVFNSLLNPSREYTNNEANHIRWISVISSMVLPQRAFAFGASFCIIALALVVHSYQLLRQPNKTPSLKINVLIGVLLGFLPIFHTHSFLAAFVILCCWSIADLLRFDGKARLKRLYSWLVIIIVTAAIALPLIYQYFLSNISGNSFFKFHPGWYANEFNINWFVFWFKNWTFVPFLATYGMFIFVRRGSTKTIKQMRLLLVLPGIILFVVPNLFLTQPWIWDNTKLFVWASLFFSPLAAYALAHIFHPQGSFCSTFNRLAKHTFFITHHNDIVYQCVALDKENDTYTTSSHPALQAQHGERSYVQIVKQLPLLWEKRFNHWSSKLRKIMQISVIAFMCSAGALDAYYTVRTDLHRYTLYNKNELALAEWVKESTSPDTIWLTSTKHNHWLFNLTGRQAVMTYPGWLWTHGYDFYSVEADVKKIFNTGDELLVEQYRVDYIIYDHAAKKDNHANLAVLKERFSIVKSLGQYIIFSAK